MVEPAGELADAIDVLRRWAETKPFVKRLFIFGSRAIGTANEQSDLDVGIEFDPVGNDEDCDTTWYAEARRWRAALKPQLPWTLQLEWHDPNGSTPRISHGKEEGAIVVYERDTYRDRDAHH